MQSWLAYCLGTVALSGTLLPSGAQAIAKPAGAG